MQSGCCIWSPVITDTIMDNLQEVFGTFQLQPDHVFIPLRSRAPNVDASEHTKNQMAVRQCIPLGESTQES